MKKSDWYAGECLDCGTTLVKRYFYKEDMTGLKHAGYGGRCSTCTNRYAKLKKQREAYSAGAIDVLESLLAMQKVTKREVSYLLKKHKEKLA